MIRSSPFFPAPSDRDRVSYKLRRFVMATLLIAPLL
jgi:hypothetical protein